MVSKVINLRAARKRKARDQATDQAAENRVKFGRTKAEKTRDRHVGEKTGRLLDGHLMDRSEEN